MGNTSLMCPMDEKDDCLLDAVSSQQSTVHSSRDIDKLSSRIVQKERKLCT